jgi:hypothetical protein
MVKRCEEASDQAQAGYYGVAEPYSFVDNTFYGKLGPLVTNQAQEARPGVGGTTICLQRRASMPCEFYVFNLLDCSFSLP